MYGVWKVSEPLPRNCCPICGYEFDDEEIQRVIDKKSESLVCRSRFGPHWQGQPDELITSDHDYAWVQ